MTEAYDKTSITLTGAPAVGVVVGVTKLLPVPLIVVLGKIAMVLEFAIKRSLMTCNPPLTGEFGPSR